MANTTGYMGFKQIGYLPGSAPDYQLQALTISNANATAIYRGDPVVFSSGVIQRAENGSTTVHGIFDGCTFVDFERAHALPELLPGYADGDGLRDLGPECDVPGTDEPHGDCHRFDQQERRVHGRHRLYYGRPVLALHG